MFATLQEVVRLQTNELKELPVKVGALTPPFCVACGLWQREPEELHLPRMCRWLALSFVNGVSLSLVTGASATHSSLDSSRASVVMVH